MQKKTHSLFTIFTWLLPVVVVIFICYQMPYLVGRRNKTSMHINFCGDEQLTPNIMIYSISTSQDNTCSCLFPQVQPGLGINIKNLRSCGMFPLIMSSYSNQVSRFSLKLGISLGY